jgi:hypothetical protein
MDVVIQREMIGLVQETPMCPFNQMIKKGIQMEEEQSSQLICVQNLVIKLKRKMNQLKTMDLVLVLIKLNYQITFLNILSEQDLTQALETKIISTLKKLMDLVQVLINYQVASKLENQQIIKNYFFII